MPRVMISYRNVPDQKDFALELNQAFKDAGVETWIDVDDIPPMTKWEDAIVDGIKESDFVVLCLSPEYYESEVCMMECYLARGYNKIILPLNIARTAPIDPDWIFADRVQYFNEATKTLEYGNFDLWRVMPQFEETKGLEDVSYGNMFLYYYLGLDLTYEERMERVVQSVTHRLPPNPDYDIYVSYKNSRSPYATKIAKDLNDAGLKTFVMTLHANLGDDWREVAWNAILQSEFRVIVMSPDVKDSIFIKNELRITRTQKDVIIIPILANDLVDDQQAQDEIIRTFTSKEFRLLTEYQWLKEETSHKQLMDQLITYIRSKM